LMARASYVAFRGGRAAPGTRASEDPSAATIGVRVHAEGSARGAAPGTAATTRRWPAVEAVACPAATRPSHAARTPRARAAWSVRAAPAGPRAAAKMERVAQATSATTRISSASSRVAFRVVRGSSSAVRASGVERERVSSRDSPCFAYEETLPGPPGHCADSHVEGVLEYQAQ
jgi:hypothetical protein